MTAPTRHPSEALILDLARGALERGRALVLRAHLAVCPGCRATLGLAEAVGGAMLDAAEPAPMAPDALASVLARLGEPPPPPPAAAPHPPGDWIRVPADVLAAAEGGRRQAAPGVWVAHVTGEGGRSGPRSYLLGVGPGIAVPLHTHRGGEFVCVVKGAYKDRGHIYRPGDFVENDESVEHQPRVTRDGECVCLIAADNLLVPRSIQARLLQPIVGI
ncbi:MAG TPA: ChrR family anti-sigma-E factor [Caulobacteraceae bacterium]|jgi:putative transcriptional regulator